MAMGDGSDVEGGVFFSERVMAGMIAKGAFVAQRFGGIDIAFKYNVGVSGHLKAVGLALDKRNGLFTEPAGEEKFVQSVGQRRAGAEGVDGVTAEEDTDGHALASFKIAAAMASGDISGAKFGFFSNSSTSASR